MASSGFKNSGPKARIFKRPLQHRLVEMMPPLYFCNRIKVMTGGWKDPLQSPFFLCIGVFRSSA